MLLQYSFMYYTGYSTDGFLLQIKCSAATASERSHVLFQDFLVQPSEETSRTISYSMAVVHSRPAALFAPTSLDHRHIIASIKSKEKSTVIFFTIYLSNNIPVSNMTHPGNATKPSRHYPPTPSEQPPRALQAQGPQYGRQSPLL